MPRAVDVGGEGFLELIEAWDGVGVVVRHDEPTGSWIFIALHDDTLGPMVGGCRMQVYARPEDGLRDAMRLGRGMTHKWAAINFPFGGAKAVLAIPKPLVGSERRGLLHRFGALLNSLDGAYGTGEDLGTTPEDLREVASVSKHVIGIHGIEDAPSDPGPFTALGVFAGIRSALRHRHGSDDLTDRSVLVQGVGHVGGPLARMISKAGGSVLLCDVDADLAFAISVEIGGNVVTQENVYRTRCDVYAPCAVGATLSPATIPNLRCDIIAGSANNQLESVADAHALAERGILYAPDYVVNAGGAMAFTLIYQGERRVAELEWRVRGIGDALDEIFAEAEAAGESPLEAAQRRVQRALQSAENRG
jgi:leucine dehydrogenase